MTVGSTSSLTLSSASGTTTAYNVPGLSISVNVPSLTSALLISSDGGVQVNSGTGGLAVAVDIMLFIDGQTLPNQIVQRRIMSLNYVIAPNTTNWAFTVSLTGITPGTHSFRIAAVWVVGSGGTSALVGGSSSSPQRGNLTVAIINP